MYTTLVDYDLKVNSQNPDELFHDAIMLMLKDCENNRDEIIKLFAQYYINEKQIPTIKVGTMTRSLFESTIAVSSGENFSIFLPKFAFTKPNNFIKSVQLVFHELEHCNTFMINKKKQFFTAGKYSSYALPSIDFKFYLCSENELKSRQAEIIFIDKFLERLKTIITSDKEFNTHKNIALYNRLKKKAEKAKNRIIKMYANLYSYLNTDIIKEKLKNKAKEYLAYIDEIYKNSNYIDPLTNITLDKRTLWLAGYLNVYNDPEIQKEIMEIAKKGRNSIWRFLDQFIANSQENLNEFGLNKFLLEYNYGGINFHDVRHFDCDMLARYSLLFNKTINTENSEFKKNFEQSLAKYKDYKFTGIPYNFFNGKYKLRINEKEYSFDTLNQLYIKALEYVDSSALIDLNDEKIRKINKTFGCRVIEHKEKTPELQQSHTIPKSKTFDMGAEMV